jgi:hypothetical protein
MSDHETDHIRDLLDRAAPAHPELGAADRATAVARRGRAARRRTQLLASGAVVAAVTAAVVVPRLVDGDSPGSPGVTVQPAPSPAPCPAQPVDVTDATPVPALGADVVSVRSCLATWTGATADDPAVDGPPKGVLTGEHAVAFAEDVDALPAYEMPSFCAAMMVAPSPWALAIGRPDGDPTVIGSTVTTCGSVRVGGVDRSAEAILAAFAGNLARQQGTDGAAALACPPGNGADAVPVWNASFDRSAATAGLVCYTVDPLGSREYADLEGSLSADQLAVLLTDIGTRTTPSASTEGGCIDTGPVRLLLLEDADGDRVALLDARCTGEFSSALGYWQPSGPAEDVIADALGGRLEQ